MCHLVEGYQAAAAANAVDGDPVPVPHFGLVLQMDAFHRLAERVAAAGVAFIIKPHVRFKGALWLCKGWILVNYTDPRWKSMNQTQALANISVSEKGYQMYSYSHVLRFTLHAAIVYTVPAQLSSMYVYARSEPRMGLKM